MSTPVSLTDVLEQQIASDPHRLAITIDGQEMTYGELHTFSDGIAALLVSLGIAPGDRVAIWLPNRPEWIGILLGCAKVGAFAVPVNTWYKSRELRFVLAKSGSRILFTQRRFLGQDFGAMLNMVEDPLPDTLEHVISVAGDIVGGRLLDDLTADTVTGEHLPAVDPDAPFLMSFTSGTTSFPKGAVLTQRAIVANAVAFARRLEVEQGAFVYCAVPFFHVAGLTFNTLCAFVRGGTLVANGRFSGAAAWDAIHRFGCTRTGGFEAIFHALIDARPAGVQSSPLRSAWWGGGPPTLFHRVESTLGVTLMNLYGLTEASGNVTSTPLHWTVDQRADSQGIGLDDATVTVVDSAGHPMNTGEIGEICVHTRGRMLEYFGDPEASARALGGNGALLTGDLGYLDDAGHLHFVGRSKDMIKVGGENVSASEVEAAISQFPGVVEVAVVGVPHPKYGEVPVAFFRSDRIMDPDEIRVRLRGSIASFKVPDRLVPVDDFPRSSTGKIIKAELRNKAANSMQTSLGSND